MSAAASSSSSSRKRNNDEIHNNTDDFMEDDDDEKDQSYSMSLSAGMSTKRTHVTSNTSRDFFVAITDWAECKDNSTWARNNAEVFIYCFKHKRLTDVFTKKSFMPSGCKECGADGAQSDAETAKYHTALYPMIIPFRAGDGERAVESRRAMTKLYQETCEEWVAHARKQSDAKAGSIESIDVAQLTNKYHKVTVAYIQYAWCISDAIREQYRQTGALHVDCKRVASTVDNLLSDIADTSQRAFMNQFRSDMRDQRLNGSPFSAVWCKQHVCTGDWLIGPNASRYKDCGLCVKPRQIIQSEVEYDRRMSSFKS